MATATTQWVDKEINDLDKAVESLIDNVEPDDRSGSMMWDNWKTLKVFQENEKISFNARTIAYNIVKYDFDQITKGPQPVEDRTMKKSGLIIAYKAENTLNYIVDRNSPAQKMLRRLLSYSGKNEIERNMFDFDNDFFIWLINRVYNANCTIETNSDNVMQYMLKSIRGFRGSADDLQTKVSAYGESVMNIISTLSFLLESNSLNMIQIDLSCTEHENISLVLQRGTVSIDFPSYQGIYEQDGPEIKYAKLYLMVYLEVLPSLVQEYQTDKENDMWNKEHYICFLNDVATNLQSRIKAKINAINAGQYAPSPD